MGDIKIIVVLEKLFFYLYLVGVCIGVSLYQILADTDDFWLPDIGVFYF